MLFLLCNYHFSRVPTHCNLIKNNSRYLGRFPLRNGMHLIRMQFPKTVNCLQYPVHKIIFISYHFLKYICVSFHPSITNKFSRHSLLIFPANARFFIKGLERKKAVSLYKIQQIFLLIYNTDLFFFSMGNILSLYIYVKAYLQNQ